MLARVGLIAIGVLLLACGAVMAVGLSDREGKADFAVVPGNKVEQTGRPSWALQARLDETLALYHKGLFSLIVVSGAHGKEGFDEGTVMKAYLVKHGVPAAAVIADNAGVNTWATARNAAALARARGLKTAFVVTQYFHVPRTRLALARFGFKDLHWAHARYWDVRDVVSVPREVLGVVDYGVRPVDGPRVSP